jgi:poly(A) polymerase/tRNA nucleotidyltransferase (CCA-adding enzyme)
MDPPAFRLSGLPLLDDPAFRRVHAALPEARLVGGCVRDALAGLPVADLDLATPRVPAEVIATLRAAGIPVAPTGLAHGTVTAVVDGRPIEITTLRRDVATDGRHATVAFTDDWRADAARRDFTINAMSMDAEGHVWDWFGGRDDLFQGVVRFVGDPATRIAEDYLRALRFFRFHARYGQGALDAAAVAAIRAAGPGLAILSAERVWSELKRILAVPDPRAAVRLMAETGVLGAVLPEATALERLDALIAAGAPADPLLRLAALCPGADVVRLAARLRLSGAEAARLASLAEPAPAGDERAWRAALAARGPEALTAASWLAEAEGRPGAWADRRAWIAATPRPVFPLRGADVLAEGVPPGPRVGAILDALERRWAEAGCRDEAETVRRWLRETVAATGA